MIFMFAAAFAAALLLSDAVAFVSLRVGAESEGREAVARVVSNLEDRARELAVATPFDELIDSTKQDSPVQGFEVRSGGDAVGDTGRPGHERRSLQGLLAARHFFRLIHASQNPSDCRRRRLLLTQFPDDSYEGLGSVISLLTIALAEAFYSNRTLIWGADLTPLLELTRPAWEKGRRRQRRPDLSAVVHGARLDCSASALGGGSFSCLYSPLSPCSLADVTAEELQGLARDGRNPAARVALMDHRRAVAAYRAPPVSVDAPGSGARWRNHLWTGALATYVARPQAAVLGQFEARRRSLAGGTWREDTACMHVRHGDVLNMPSVYRNREAFPFTAYFQALRNTAHVPDLQEELPGAAPPGEQPDAIFVASDSPDVGDAVVEETLDRTRLEREGREPAPPILLVPSAAGRFVTLYGSHTVAAGSAVCSRTKCGLPYGALDHFDSLLDSSGPSRPARLLQVMFEAAEDLQLISRCTRFASTASSRYGAIAASLVWAATGGAGVPATAFLDAKAIASGELQSAWLHWSTNGTSRATPGARWLAFSRLFLDGLWSEGDWADSPAVNFSGSVNAGLPLISLRSFIPAVPPEVFWPEALRSLGLLDAGAGARRDAVGRKEHDAVSAAVDASSPQPSGRLWPGECPLLPDGTVDMSTQALAVVAQINGGVQHLEQAVLCWAEASRLLEAHAELPASSRDGSITPELEEAYIDVIRGNTAAVAAQHSYPYGLLRPAALQQLVARNVPAAASAFGLPGGRTESSPAFPPVPGREGAGGWIPKRAS